jgi:hypothetical protein
MLICNFEMKKFVIHIVVLFTFFGNEKLFAQSPAHNIALTSTEQGSVLLKCFSQEVYFDNGMNVYRRAESEPEWTKLNVAPIKKGDYLIPQNIIDKDKVLKRLIDFATKVPHEKIKGIVKITMLIDAIQNNEYAKFLGILYEDKSIQKGLRYEYKVCKITSTNSEEIVSVSELFVAGTPVKIDPPQNIETKKHEKKVEFKWKIEVERYYAVNVFMGMKKDLSDQKLMTPTPLMVTKVKNPKGVMEWPSVFYQKDSLKKKAPYYFRFTAIDYFNQEGPKSETFEIIPPDETPPHSPENFKLESKDFTFSLKWNTVKSPDLMGYNIYRSTSDKLPYVKVNTNLLKAKDTVFTNTVSKPGAYYFYVASVDSALNEGKSAKLTKEAFDNVPPDAVKNVTAKVEPGKIMLTWQANIEGDLLGYIVLSADNMKRGKDHNKEPHFSPMITKPIKSTEYIAIKPKDVKNEFLYKVIAIDTNFNRSAPSEIAKIKLPDVTPPTPPFIKEININESGFALIEFLPDLSPDLKGYHVYRSEKHDSANYKRINLQIIPPTSTSFVDRNISPDTLYHFYLVAIDSAGNISRPSVAFPFEKPVVKDILQSLKEVKYKYNRRNNQIELSWELKKDPNVIGFTVFRKTNLEDVFTPISGLIKNNSFYDNKIFETIKTYQYEVREYSKHGTVEKSPILTIEIK